MKLFFCFYLSLFSTFSGFALGFTSMFNTYKQGDTFVLVSGGEFKTIKFILKKDNKIINRGRGFSFNLDKKNKVSMILIGTNAFYKTGKYKVYIEASGIYDSNRIATELVNLELKKKKFKEEFVNFGKKSTSVIKTKTHERKKQSAILTKVIVNFDSKGKYMNGYFSQPLSYVYYTSPYGTSRVNNFSDGSKSKTVHYAIDYRGKIGTAIFAPASGKVVFADRRITTGFTVVLEHLPGVYSLFYHLSKISVKNGELVKKSSKIGEIGNTGFSTGSHLHWEMRVNITQVNPLFFIKNNVLDKKKILKLIKK